MLLEGESFVHRTGFLPLSLCLFLFVTEPVSWDLERKLTHAST